MQTRCLALSRCTTLLRAGAAPLNDPLIPAPIGNMSDLETTVHFDSSDAGLDRYESWASLLLSTLSLMVGGCSGATVVVARYQLALQVVSFIQCVTLASFAAVVFPQVVQVKVTGFATKLADMLVLLVQHL